MTVAEYIEKLKALPQDLTVYRVNNGVEGFTFEKEERGPVLGDAPLREDDYYRDMHTMDGDGKVVADTGTFVVL